MLRIPLLGETTTRYADMSGAPASTDTGMASNDISGNAASPVSTQDFDPGAIPDPNAMSSPQDLMNPGATITSAYNDSNKSFLVQGACFCQQYGLEASPQQDEDGVSTCQNCGEECSPDFSPYDADEPTDDIPVPGFDSFDNDDFDTLEDQSTQDNPGYEESQLWNEGRDLVEDDFSGPDLDANFYASRYAANGIGPGASPDSRDQPGYLDESNDCHMCKGKGVGPGGQSCMNCEGSGAEVPPCQNCEGYGCENCGGSGFDSKYGTSSEFFQQGYEDRINGEPPNEALQNVSDSYGDGYDAGSFYNETAQESAPQRLQDMSEGANEMVRNKAASRKFSGHNWELKSDDEYAREKWKDDPEYLNQINHFALDDEENFHNGPRCKDCGYTFCEHCGDPQKKWNSECPSQKISRKCKQCYSSLRHDSSHRKCSSCGVRVACATCGCGEPLNPHLGESPEYSKDFLGGESDASDEAGYGVEGEGTNTEDFDGAGYRI